MNDKLDWRQRAACRNEHPELFFPVGKDGPALAQLQEAKAVCGWCPVRPECLDFALNTGQDHGVYGGMSETERRALRRRNARPTPKPKTSGDPLGQRSEIRQTAAKGQDALLQGMCVEDAAAKFGVTIDTARRWRREAQERAS